MNPSIFFSLIFCFFFLTCIQSKQNIKNYIRAPQKPSILFVHMSGGMGGSEITSSSMYRLMHKNGFTCTMLVPENSPLDVLLTSNKVQHYYLKRQNNYETYQSTLAKLIHSICKRYNINIIQYFIPSQIHTLKQATKKLDIRLVLLRHVAEPLDSTYLKNVDGILAVSPAIKEYLQNKNKTDQLNIKQISTIYPFFYEEKFLAYQQPLIARNDFFKERCGFSISNEPVICSIANFYSPTLHKKNQELLLNALDILVHKKNIQAHVLFVGDGPDLERHKKLCVDLNLEKYAHFLGFRNDISDLLFFSDFHVLPSITEAFGIVHLEAALLKRPSIGATNTGSEYAIIHETTGLLFENNNCTDLVKALEIMARNHTLRETMGKNAYAFVTGRKNFGQKPQPFLQYKKLILLTKFYKRLLLKKQV